MSKPALLKNTSFQEMVVLFDKFLQDWINTYQQKIPPENKQLIKAIKYALKGGKRFRVLLALSVAKSLNTKSLLTKESIQKENMHFVLPFACGVEFIHTYSLVHDDLPAMDNASQRRGRLSLHKAFDEATAILVGDTLLTEAFSLVAYYPIHAKALVELLALAAGGQGMISGQMMDLQAKNHAHLDLEKLYTLKTGALILAPVVGTATLLKARTLVVTHLEKFAQNLGIAFQIADDLEDFDSTDSHTVPSINCVQRWGFHKAKKKLQDYSLNAIKALEPIAENLDITHLVQLVELNVNRSR